MNMNDRMRISDSDRERVAAQLRDYYAEGRLTAEELDERVTAALSAKTVGDLRGLMTDLPSPAPAEAGAGAPNTPPFAAPPWLNRRRGPRLLPVLLLILFAALLLPGGWIFFALLKVFLLFWLVVALMGMVGAMVFRHRVRRVFRDRMGNWQGTGGPGQGWFGQDWFGQRWSGQGRGPGQERGPGQRRTNWRGW
jgi:Domain of unknown function (DUF1707)